MPSLQAPALSRPAAPLPWRARRSPRPPGDGAAGAPWLWRDQTLSLPGLGRRPHVRALLQRRREGWGRARLVLGAFHPGLGQGCQRRRGHRLSLLGVMRRVGHVPGQAHLTCRGHPRWRVAARLPALLGGAQAMQLGSRQGTRGLVVGGLHHRLGGCAAAGLARACALRFCCGSALPLGLALPPWPAPPTASWPPQACSGAPHGGPTRRGVRPPAGCRAPLPPRRPAAMPASPRPQSPRADAPLPAS